MEKGTEAEMWLWTITDARTGKRRRLAWRMTEQDARERYGQDAQRVEWSREVRQPIGEHFRP